MSSQIEVSVILSTYNRAAILPAALEALLAQRDDSPPYEVIVVDNNSTDETAGIVRSFSWRSAIFRYVFEPQQGLSYGYNTGIRHARGPLLAFIDDDVTPANDWVRAIKQAFDVHPEIDFLGGRVLPRWKDEPPSWLTRCHWTPLALEDAEAPFYSTAETRRGVLGKCFRTHVFGAVGGFAPELGRIKDSIGSVEDRDLITRLWRIGGQGMHVPEVVVYTEVGPERLTKAYHRRWHTGHGRFFAVMRDAAFEQSRLRCFGVPAHVWRTAVRDALRWTIDTVRGREAEALAREAHLCFCIGFARERVRQVAHGVRQAPMRPVNVRESFGRSIAVLKRRQKRRDQRAISEM